MLELLIFIDRQSDRSRTKLVEQWISDHRPEVTRDHIGAYIESLLTRASKRTGKPLTAKYARSHYRALQQFFKYLAAEGIIPADPFDKMALPDAPERLVEVPADDALRQLLAECAGTDFNDLRDTAIIRMFADTGCRAGEIAGLDIDGIDFAENTALVVGKGRRPRTTPFGDKTRTALRKYLRARAKHPKARRDETSLWLGYQGRMTAVSRQSALGPSTRDGYGSFDAAA
ncbi:tyrosine-type recombinase/integrase [Nocardia sp. CDC160]|uniref:tyrosine-type recombinase/integrase n=1 Tax=Nocardia sp. CDC160 TaxID=3112166 RepID=UPI002DB94AE9|nr:tyrosine-type recombinase/integrase [Nocardia sp. CDC160]MEC3916029.1 tyrosine-type recombinase/integrase [Nocardia sp. CDC160]